MHLADSLGLQALVLSGEMIGEALVPQLGQGVDLVVTDHHKTDSNCRRDNGLPRSRIDGLISAAGAGHNLQQLVSSRFSAQQTELERSGPHRCGSELDN